MTIGQRIAQKRKELGLSQEGLGEKLGVSRQAIYKWESDSSLPEIDKLITLSRLFSVPVGWLLGVEEDEPEAVNPDQEKLVEDILSRYQESQPKPRKSAWDKWSVRILFAMCGIMLALLVSTNGKVKEMEQQYVNMANSIGEVNYSVDRQINSIATRVEDILKSQNNLMAEWSAEVASTDLAANTVTFDVRAVPRTYVEGMTAIFVARSGEDTVELPVEPGEDHAFAGQITCPLTDKIDVTAVLVTGDKRETQWLNDFYGLYEKTFPWLNVTSWLWSEDLDENGVLPVSESSGVTVCDTDSINPLGFRPAPPAKLQVGLFQDGKLLFWYEEQERDVNYNGSRAKEYIWIRTQEVTPKPGSTYREAAVYTDEYGRQRVYAGGETTWDTSEEANGTSASAVAVPPSNDPADWEF